jgi:hypothetical protein
MWDSGAARRREVYLCVQRGRRERTLSAREVASEVEEEVEDGRSCGRRRRVNWPKGSVGRYRRMKKVRGAMAHGNAEAGGFSRDEEPKE